jgi:hypothetical protein
MTNSFREKLDCGSSGLAFGVTCLVWAPTPPKPEGLVPNLEPAQALQETMPAPPRTLSAPEEAPLS